MRDCILIGCPIVPPYEPIGDEGKALPVYASGMVKVSRSHPQYPTTPGGKIDASGCVYANWPGDAFTGDLPHDGSGFTRKTVTTSIDYRPVIDALLSNEISTAEASRRIREGAWK
jgi:hypothetical protein